MERLIEADRSIIVACDVPTTMDLGELVKATHEVPGIGGYKVGLELVIRYGLSAVVGMVRMMTELPVIYDHQKGGTDIPKLGAKFAGAVVQSGAEAVILFPFGGAETEKEWIEVCQDKGLVVLVGGHMTQPMFLARDGGFIDDDGPLRIYELAADCGATDFVVPGNNPEAVANYREFFEVKCGDGYTLYAPGFVDQGGVITDCGQAAGDNWHAISGSAIYGAEDMTAAAEKLTAQIV